MELSVQSEIILGPEVIQTAKPGMLTRRPATARLWRRASVGIADNRFSIRAEAAAEIARTRSGRQSSARRLAPDDQLVQPKEPKEKKSDKWNAENKRVPTRSDDPLVHDGPSRNDSSPCMSIA